MSSATDSAISQWNERRSLRASYYDEESSEYNEDWANEHAQSSSLTRYGLVWGLAIVGAFGMESDIVSRITLSRTSAAQYVPFEMSGQVARRSQAIALLDEWLSDESGYDEETWPEIKEAIDRDRLAGRRLFDG